MAAFGHRNAGGSAMRMANSMRDQSRQYATDQLQALQSRGLLDGKGGLVNGAFGGNAGQARYMVDQMQQLAQGVDPAMLRQNSFFNNQMAEQANPQSQGNPRAIAGPSISFSSGGAPGKVSQGVPGSQMAPPPSNPIKQNINGLF